MSQNKVIQLNKPYVSFIFDDCKSSIYTNVLPLFKERNIKGNIALWSGLLDDNVDLSIKEIYDFKDNDWELLSHGYESSILTESSTDEIATIEIEESRKMFDNYGIHVNGYVPSNNSIPSKFRDILEKNYSFCIRKINNTSNESNSNVYDLDRVSIDDVDVGNSPTVTLDEIKSKIDNTKENNKLLIFYCHNVGITDGYGKEYIAKETFISILDYIISEDIKIDTMSNILEECSDIFRANEIKREDIILSNNIIKNSEFAYDMSCWIENKSEKVEHSVLKNYKYNGLSIDFLENKPYSYYSISQTLPLNFDTINWKKSENTRLRLDLPIKSSVTGIGQIRIIVNGSSNSNSTLLYDKTFTITKYKRNIVDYIYCSNKNIAIDNLNIKMSIVNPSNSSMNIIIGKPCLRIYDIPYYNTSKIIEQYNMSENIVFDFSDTNEKIVPFSINSFGDTLDNFEWECPMDGYYKISGYLALIAPLKINSTNLKICIYKNDNIISQSRYIGKIHYNNFSTFYINDKFIKLNYGDKITIKISSSNKNKTIIAHKDESSLIIEQIV